MQTSPATCSISMAARKIAILCGVATALTLAAAPESWAQFLKSPQFVDSPQVVLFGGTGVNLSKGHSQAATQLGASIGLAPTNSWAGFLLEGGYLAPWANFKSGSAFFSANYLVRWKIRTDENIIPFVTTGYSRLFDAGNAINFGGGLEYKLGATDAIRIEVRDYYAFTEQRKQNPALRVGWVMYLPD